MGVGEFADHHAVQDTYKAFYIPSPQSVQNHLFQELHGSNILELKLSLKCILQVIMSLLDIFFYASKMLGNNLSTLPLNFSISVFQLHHILWTGTKLSSSSFWTSSKSSSKVFSPSLAFGSTENASVPNGFSVHRKSLFSFPVLTAIYISIFILQNFSELFSTVFFPPSHLVFSFFFFNKGVL